MSTSFHPTKRLIKSTTTKILILAMFVTAIAMVFANRTDNLVSYSTPGTHNYPYFTGTINGGGSNHTIVNQAQTGREGSTELSELFDEMTKNDAFQYFFVMKIVVELSNVDKTDSTKLFASLSDTEVFRSDLFAEINSSSSTVTRLDFINRFDSGVTEYSEENSELVYHCTFEVLDDEQFARRVVDLCAAKARGLIQERQLTVKNESSSRSLRSRED